MKKTVPINDGWLFAPGFDRRSLAEDFDFGGYYPVSLPHCVATPIEGYGGGDESDVATYVRVIELSAEYESSRLELCFGGVMSYIEVYVNGMFVTSHKGDTPFTVDVSAPLRVGYANRIVLKVDSMRRSDVPLTVGSRPLPHYCGIYRGVRLKAVSGGEIESVFVKSVLSENDAELEVEVSLGEYYPDSRIFTEIYDGEGNKVVSLTEKAVLGPSVTLTGSVTGIKRWSVDEPVLYTAVTTLKYGKHVMDIHTTDFGFRTAEFKDGTFLLNGTALKLIGLVRMDDYPELGRAATDGLQRFDARLLKELGCTAVRTVGLAAESFIAECDRLGLLVIEDMGDGGETFDADWRDGFVAAVESTVKRDRNHPSVIAWGVRAGSTADCDELYFKTGKAAHSCDPTRATLGTRDFMDSRLYEDIFAYADYGSGEGASRRSKTVRLSVPYFISEHTGKRLPVKRYDREELRSEQARRHLKFLDSVLGSERISGCTGMAFADFNCMRKSGSGDGFMHYGVLDPYRLDKTAACAYRAQSAKEPYLEVSSNLAPDEFCLPLTVYTNCDSVRLYRDGCSVGEFFPDKKTYPSLKHAPIVIDDPVGGAMAEGERLPPKQAALIKYAVNAARKKGSVSGLPFPARMAAWLARKSLKMSKETLSDILRRYALADAAYEIEGITEGQSVIKKSLSTGSPKVSLRITASDTELHPSDTYETVLVRVESVDENGRVLDFDFSPIKINVEGEMNLVGGDLRSLCGGATGFFLTTTPYDGTARVTVDSGYGMASLDLEVIHERVEKL